MGSLLLSLLPVALGIVLSPLAIVAVIVVLVSPRGRVTSVAFLVGWVLGIVTGVGVSYLVLRGLEVDAVRADPPTWVGFVHLGLGVVLLVGAWWVYARQQQKVRQLAVATGPIEVAGAVPTLPGWLQQVEHFTPIRTALLGAGLMLLNPVDLSCAIGAGLEFVLNPVSTVTGILVLILFVVVAGSSVIAPVLILLIGGESARPLLERLRSWIAGHTGLVNALLLVVIGALQLVKAFQLIF